jgi:hypothetical protein
VQFGALDKTTNVEEITAKSYLLFTEFGAEEDAVNV